MYENRSKPVTSSILGIVSANKMEYAEEIRSNIKNIQYYVKKIDEACHAQFNNDIKAGNENGFASPASIRFEALGCIESAGARILLYCDNLLANVKIAEEQDNKILYKEESEGENSGEQEVRNTDEIPF